MQLTMPSNRPLFPPNPSAGELNASNPYNVGAIQGVTFNNLRCSMVMAAPQPQAPPALPPAAEAAAQPTDLQIEYTPIECEWWTAGCKVAHGRCPFLPQSAAASVMQQACKLLHFT